jgi:hypothetical protein
MAQFDAEAEARKGDALDIETVRGWTAEQRLAVACQMTAIARSASREAWRRSRPEEPTLLADIAWAEAQYGEAIGTALRSWYAKRS